MEQSSYVAVNPNRQPGGFVFGGTVAGRESLSGQIACRLALEHFSDGVLRFFEKNSERKSGIPSNSLTVEVLETAFREANDAVYQFGHSMAAGGRMAATLLGLVVHNQVAACARVGQGSVYLVRGGEAFSFFETQVVKTPGPNQQYVGGNSLLQVELASIGIESGDILIASSEVIPQEGVLADFFREYDFDNGKPAYDLCHFVFPELQNAHFVAATRVGADAIYLSEVVG